MEKLARQLLNVFGPSGKEQKIADEIRGLVSEYVNDIVTDALGNLICVKCGKESGRKLMFSAHMDQIGFIVMAVEKEGYLRVYKVGGIHQEVSHTRHVVFENGVQGVIVQQALEHGESADFRHLFIDIGAESREEALQMVSLGDMAVYAPDCFPLGKHKLCSPAMDNRISCALLVSLLQSLPKETEDTVIAVFSVQEEVGCRGAQTAAFAVEPDIGIALDVTLCGDYPEAKYPALDLGKGPALKIMDRLSISNPEVVEELQKAADEAGVPVQREILPYGGTDAGAIQRTKGGIKVATLSIPDRYVHSACEVIDLRDVEHAKKLLLKYIK